MIGIRRGSRVCLLATSLVVRTAAEQQSGHLYLGGGLTILTQNLLDGKRIVNTFVFLRGLHLHSTSGQGLRTMATGRY
jgi:hypothetical protein